jgi:arylsulfatase B
MKRIAWAAAACLALCAVGSAQHNILLVVADDLGVDRVGAYAEHPNPGSTPRIDQLAADGLLFRNAWSNPLCSPTRATLLTGRYSFREGLGTIINYATDLEELPVEALTLPELLAPTYQSGAIGKWHLSTEAGHGADHPLLSGFRTHSGSMQSFPGTIGDAYYDWSKCADGIAQRCTTYATTDNVDAALQAMAALKTPWFVYLAFNAPHSPFHKPPANLHTQTLPASVQGNIPIHMKAMAEAMDTELGRLLDSMDPAMLADTVIVFVGDNGTDALATTAPFLPSHAKGTLYEGGINVPLIISGPGIVSGRECGALVNTTDLYATLAEIGGVPSEAEDSVSLVPYFTDPTIPSLRSWVYAESFNPNGFGIKPSWRRAARDARFKYIAIEHEGIPYPAPAILYDLQNDPFELDNLLEHLPLSPEASASLNTLRGVFLSLDFPPWTDVHHGLAGVDGVPVLAAEGTLRHRAPVSISLASAALFLGFHALFAPFKGGVCVPAPDIALTGLLTSSAGGMQFDATWPDGIPSKTALYLQAWVADAAAPAGLAASNGLLATTP